MRAAVKTAGAERSSGRAPGTANTCGNSRDSSTGSTSSGSRTTPPRDWSSATALDAHRVKTSRVRCRRGAPTRALVHRLRFQIKSWSRNCLRYAPAPEVVSYDKINVVDPVQIDAVSIVDTSSSTATNTMRSAASRPSTSQGSRNSFTTERADVHHSWIFAACGSRSVSVASTPT